MIRAALVCLVLCTGCVSPALNALVATEIGAQTKDLEDWDKLSNDQQKASAVQSLKAMTEVKWRLDGNE